MDRVGRKKKNFASLFPANEYPWKCIKGEVAAKSWKPVRGCNKVVQNLTHWKLLAKGKRKCSSSAIFISICPGKNTPAIGTFALQIYMNPRVQKEVTQQMLHTRPPLPFCYIFYNFCRRVNIPSYWTWQSKSAIQSKWFILLNILSKINVSSVKYKFNNTKREAIIFVIQICIKKKNDT